MRACMHVQGAPGVGRQGLSCVWSVSMPWETMTHGEVKPSGLADGVAAMGSQGLSRVRKVYTRWGHSVQEGGTQARWRGLEYGEWGGRP